MKKEELLQIKKEKGAKHLFVDYRYKNTYVCLYSDEQKDFVIEICKGSYDLEALKVLCTKDTVNMTKKELLTAYDNYTDMLD